jgi:hypothetical protein
VTVYRAAGWSLGGELRTLDVPSALLPRHRPDADLVVRPGSPADLAVAQRLYAQTARRRHGLLTHRGAPFAPPDGDPVLVAPRGSSTRACRPAACP